VAKVIGGTTWGAAKASRLHSVRVRSCEGTGSEEDLLAGLRWVKQNAQRPAVVNLSLGTIGNVTAVNSATQDLIHSGFYVVIAAGQDDVDACTVSPARVASALTVAASDTQDKPIGDSNFGPCIDMFAPGAYPAARPIKGSSYAAGNTSGVAAVLIQRNGFQTQAVLNDQIIGNATTGSLQGLSPGTPNRLLYGRVFPKFDSISALVPAVDP
jgi:aqualysin 1